MIEKLNDDIFDTSTLTDREKSIYLKGYLRGMEEKEKMKDELINFIVNYKYKNPSKEVNNDRTDNN
jgi:hypothetical protein